MTTTSYRAFHALAVATVIVLGTWIIVKQFCDIPTSWRAMVERVSFAETYHRYLSMTCPACPQQTTNPNRMTRVPRLKFLPLQTQRRDPAWSRIFVMKSRCDYSWAHDLEKPKAIYPALANTKHVSF